MNGGTIENNAAKYGGGIISENGDASTLGGGVVEQPA
jgi:hypothetical protein